jgi:Phage integrase, N-terminal SAM-like domain
MDLDDPERGQGKTLEETPGREVRLESLVREWLLDLQVLGRSRNTIDWYEQKMRWFLAHGEARTLDQLTAFELKCFLAEQQSRGLSDNSVRGDFQTIKALASWAARENYRVDPALLRVRAPKVAQKEMETCSAEQQQAILRAAPAGWARMAVAILLGTGMRAGELCALGLGEVFFDLEWDRGTESLQRLDQKVRSYNGYFKNRRNAELHHVLFVLPHPAREKALFGRIQQELPTFALSCCRYWLTNRPLLEKAGPLAEIWLYASPPKEPMDDNGLRWRAPARGRRLGLVELPARRRQPWDLLACIGKPGWWHRRPGGPEGA